MKSSRNLFQLVACLLLCSLPAIAQSPATDAKQFSKDGLTFSYPVGWSIEDSSNEDLQQLTLTNPRSEAQLRLFVHRGRISADKLAQAKKSLIDPYLASTFKQFEDMGAKPVRSDASLDIGSTKAEGVIIRAMLDEPGAAEIYWALINQRVVVLTLFGPDKALKQAAPVWDQLRKSLQIAESQPADKPTPKPTPK
ncbi:MAG: hypothetical protein H7Z16_13385 [Pyrinomonadaceae bacterium]|nr:hypothetical protein [Pyrinomonadaceae bacterium]